MIFAKGCSLGEDAGPPKTSPPSMQRHITAAKDKIPVFEKIMYGMGSGSFQLAADGVKGLANPIFNITLGLSPSLVGLVLMISRFFDAFTDPIMGKISDDCRTRFGRRRPFIFVGSFLTAGAFIAIWLVPAGWSHTGIFIYYLIAMLFFFLCATIQTVPYHTLGLEMTADTHERTVVAGYKMFFSFGFIIMVPWVFRLAQADVFENVMEGMRFLSWGVGLAIIVGGVLPAIFVKERYYHIAKNQAKEPFWKGLKLTFSNKPFLVLTGIILGCGIGSNMVNALGSYIIFYYIYEGDLKAGAQLAAIGANVFTICAILCIPILTWLSARIGKINTLKWLIVIGIVGSFSKFSLYNKDHHWLLFISQAMVAPMAAGFWTITSSMKADICDDDELQHGMRREGMFGSVGNWILKTAMALTFFGAGVILDLVGFDVALKGNQSADTLLWMRMLFALVPAVFSFLALFLLSSYSLSEKRMEEIRAALEARRSQVA
jgi:GPH family glycoside/pentoside/hexuronide:cation symporter